MIAQITKPKLTEPKLTRAKFTGPNPTEAKFAQPKETRVFRRIVPVIGFLAGLGVALSVAPAWAQVNIDQGKSAAEMFSGDCGTCHKSAKGLANGRNSGALAGFLREHYTSGPQQAASLAAYVLGAGSGPAPTANLKPGTGEKPGDKTRPGRPESSSTAKLQQPDQDTKIEAEPASEPAPAANGRKPAAGKHEPRSVTASRGSRQEPETPPPAPEAAPVTAPVATPETAPAPVATAPATSEPSSPAAPAEPQPVTAAAPGAVPESGSAPAAAAPANAAAPGEAPPGEGAPAEDTPVPRDDIPD
jgi:hypothetical protein